MTDPDDMVATDLPLDDFSSEPTCRTCLAQLNLVRTILDTATDATFACTNAATAVNDFGRIDHFPLELSVATVSSFFSTQRLLQIIVVLGATVVMKLVG